MDETPDQKLPKRYEALADEIAASIRSGALRAGDRLPSVRQASAARRVSPSTVFEAYYLLEARGLIAARPRSGYYVTAAQPVAQQRMPEPAQPVGEVQAVAVAERVQQLLGLARERDLAPLGSAFPSPALFPLATLSRALGRAMRVLDPWRTVEDLSPGHEGLRRQIAIRYIGAGFSLDPAELVICNGAMEALNLCLEAVTRPGDLVAVESPCFYGALQALERLGLRAVEVATDPRGGVDLGSLAALLERHPIKACWLMPNFQNPLGSLMPVENKRALVALLRERGVPLIEDDVYGELYFGERRPPPAKAFDEAGLVLHCGSFSKSLAPGYRVGWAAAGRHAQEVARRKLMSSLSAAVPSQEGLAEYLRHGAYDRHLRQLRRTLADGQARALRAIDKHFPPGTRVTRPEGGYFCWVELPPAVDALALHRLALSHRISVAPGALFSADQRFRHHLRINYGHPEGGRTEAALKTLGQLARSLCG
ncbi:PLP-dependent aminotransferase family protein [Paucibacter sp. R3-3]|uniref:PLP-dependent aminotransferase family protein n=1 Tax=Roseateles agri TaxID=3098619 RepID=A0ABU5DCQ7_9BURK|nr:PLP-dependent aminotransferase family protein [Paucibacter sp. R3-3]MDY0743919.1 PLP-dependent aminotransferase family protein [Paucibacter sp. R3-3]